MSTRANKSEVTNQILLGLTELHRLSKRDEPLSITGILTSHGLSFSRAKSIKEKYIAMLIEMEMEVFLKLVL